jgi:hypothetical protein
MIRVWDISEFQTITDWTALTQAYPVGIARAHNGYRADKKFAINQAKMRHLCLIRGYYLYLAPDRDAASQAFEFKATTGVLQKDEFWIIDAEVGAGNQDARVEAARTALADPAHEWVYSYVAFIKTHLPGEPIDWIAAYQNGEPTQHHLLWQNTDKFQFPGIAAPSDGSIFDGAINDLFRLTGWPISQPQEDEVEALLKDPASTAQFYVLGSRIVHITTMSDLNYLVNVRKLGYLDIPANIATNLLTLAGMTGLHEPKTT